MREPLETRQEMLRYENALFFFNYYYYYLFIVVSDIVKVLSVFDVWTNKKKNAQVHLFILLHFKRIK